MIPAIRLGVVVVAALFVVATVGCSPPPAPVSQGPPPAPPAPAPEPKPPPPPPKPEPDPYETAVSEIGKIMERYDQSAKNVIQSMRG